MILNDETVPRYKTICVLEKSGTSECVLTFAQVMEQKLSEKRHKGDREGWLQKSPAELLELLKKEVTELQAELMNAGEPSAVKREAADVANFAMMVADCYQERHPDRMKRLFS